jgi:hypothetical protein
LAIIDVKTTARRKTFSEISDIEYHDVFQNFGVAMEHARESGDGEERAGQDSPKSGPWV